MNDWQPIETAPKNGTHVLLYHKGGSIASGRWGKPFHMWLSSYRPSDTECDLETPQPTHWMPLPPPPKE